MSASENSYQKPQNEARALWFEAARLARLRAQPLPAPGPDEALVATSWSAISRGTERLVFEGRVPVTEHARMRAPFQDGDFSFPVKYGYCAAGVVEAGPADWIGRAVFCLHPHQDFFVTPISALRPIPPATPLRRATLGANMETALNALWDAGAGPGDRVIVVGAGVLGLLIAFLAARLPGAEVAVVDKDEARRPVCSDLGVLFRSTRELSPETLEADVVFHASATAAGLALAIACGGLEAKIVETSWHGAGDTPVPLGGAFHAKRLQLISSQVGHVAASRRARWTYARRLDKALELLGDERLDALIGAEVAFSDAAQELPRLLAADAPGLATVIRYPSSR